MRIADENDASKTITRGAFGELMVRGAIVMMGVFNNEDQTRGTIEPDAWLHTGDLEPWMKTDVYLS